MSPRRVEGALVRLLLRLYPGAYRRAHGETLARTYHDTLRERGAGPGTVWWLLRDALTTSARVRAADRTNRSLGRRMGASGGEGMMRMMIEELRMALRTLGRSPAFAVVVVLTMGLGIGANTAVFSVAYGLLVEPLPYEEPHELVWVQNRYLPRGSLGAVSAPEFWEFRQNQPAFDAMSVFGTEDANLTGLETPVRLQGLYVSANYFDLLGRRPILGRGFAPEEEEPGRADVVVIGHALWSSAFGSDPAVLGRQIELDGDLLTVIGVTAPDFEPLAPFLFTGRRVEFWRPYPLDPATFDDRSVERHGLWVVGRLADAGDVAAAEQGLLAAIRRVEARYADISNAGERDVAVTPLRTRIAGQMPGFLGLLGIAVALLLLLTSLNVTHMLVARAEARGGEVAVRAALGAGRSRLVTHGMAESVVIGLAGGALGVGFAAAVLRGVPLFASDLALPSEAPIGAPVIAFTFALSLLAGAIAGAIPAARLVRGDLFGLVTSGSGRTLGGPKQRLERTLVVAQVAGTVVLLSSAGLVLRSLAGLRSVDAGFDASGLHLVAINAQRSDYPTLEAVRQLYESLEQRLVAAPGVESVTASWQTPLQSGMSDWPVMPDVDGEAEWYGADPNWVTPSYFETYGIELVAGRLFEPSDLEADQGPVVLSESAARRLWPDGEAVGRRVNLDFREPVWREVIGVVRDLRGRGLREEPRLQTYLTFAPGPFGPNPNLTLTVRSGLGEGELRGHLVDALATIAPNVPVDRLVSMETQIADTLLAERILSATLSFFAALALVLGMMGVYGLVAFSVHARRREIGLRIAMGAERGGVLGLVLSQGLRLGAVGVLLGIGGAAASGRLLEGFLFGVSSSDPVTLGAVSVCVVAVTLAASYWPARRAASIDPLSALRAE